MFKPAPLYHVRYVFMHNLLLGKLSLFCTAYNFSSFLGTCGWFTIAHYYPSAFSVGDSFSTDNCNKFVSLDFICNIFSLVPLAVSLDRIKVTKFMKFSLKPCHIQEIFYRISRSGIHRNSDRLFFLCVHFSGELSSNF